MFSEELPMYSNGEILVAYGIFICHRWGEMSSGAENCVKQNSALNGSRAALADTPKFLILP
jgi:hypothetical protein